MSDPTNGHSKIGMGVQAYRWMVGVGMGLLVLLSQRTLAGIDETSTAVRSLQIEVRTMQGTTESRFNAHAQRLDTMDRRNDTQDAKIDSLWQRLWSHAPNTRNTP